MREIQFRPECSPRITLVAFTIATALPHHHPFAINSSTNTKASKLLLVGNVHHNHHVGFAVPREEMWKFV
jgi:hypothetical protein